MKVNDDKLYTRLTSSDEKGCASLQEHTELMHNLSDSLKENNGLMSIRIAVSRNLQEALRRLDSATRRGSPSFVGRISTVNVAI